MKSDWPLVAIRNLVQQVEQSVKPQRATTYRLLGVRWYGLGPFVREEVTTTTSKATRLFPVQPGQFVYNRLFAWKGSFGVISAEHKGCHVSGEFPLFEVDTTQLLVDYLFLYMNRPTIWESIEIESTGSTSVSRNRWKEERFLGWKIRLPSVPAQQRIVDLISSVDSYIATLQQQADAARVARAAVLSELLSAGGEDWTETSIGEIAEVIGGGTPSTSKSEYWGGEIVWLTPTEVVPRDGQLLLDSERRITNEGLRNSGANLLPTGSVILTSRASVGFVGISGVELCTNQGFQSLVPGDTALAKFLMYWIQSNRAEFESRAAGSTFKEISKSNVKSIQLLLPSLPEQKRIVEIVSSIDDVIRSTEQAVADAKHLRSGLLSDLLSGNHEIPESYDRLLGAA